MLNKPFSDGPAGRAAKEAHDSFVAAINEMKFRLNLDQDTSERSHHVEYPVDYLAHWPLAWPARRAGLWQVRRDHAPLCVR